MIERPFGSKLFVKSVVRRKGSGIPRRKGRILALLIEIHKKGLRFFFLSEKIVIFCVAKLCY